MEILVVGDYIKNRREMLKLKQRDLCEGICDVVTLSRIENGKTLPSARKLNALLERLGLPGERIYTLVNAEEKKIDELREAIELCEDLPGKDPVWQNMSPKQQRRNPMQCNLNSEQQDMELMQDNLSSEHQDVESERENLSSKNRQRALDLLDELEALVGDQDILLEQYILRCRALFGTREKLFSSEERIEMLNNAIRMTVPRFDSDEIGSFRYSLDEMELINQIARAYSDADDHEEALAIYRQCFRYVQKNNQNMERSGGLIPMVACNYARELGKCGFLKKALEITETGRQTCILTGHYQYFPELISLRAELYGCMGDEKAAREQADIAWAFASALNEKADRAVNRSSAEKEQGIS